MYFLGQNVTWQSLPQSIALKLKCRHAVINEYNIWELFMGTTM